MAYEGIDKKIYESGIHYRPLQEYTTQQYKWPTTTEEDQLTTATGSAAGIPYTNAFTNAGDGPGQVPLGLTYDPRAVAKGPASGNYPITEATLKKGTSLQYEWPGEKEYVPSYITDQNLQDTYTGSTAYPVWDDKFQSTKDYWANKVLSADEQAFFDKKKAEFSLPEDEEKESWYSSLFAPRVQGTLGTRALAQYQAGQKLPFFLSNVAGMQSPFNPESANYNPNWEDQLNYLEMEDMVGIDPTSGLRKYTDESVLAGQNVWSGRGSNDPEEQLRKQLKKYKHTWDTKIRKNKKWDDDRKERWRKKYIGAAEKELSDLTTDDQRRADEYRAKQDTPGILYDKDQAKQNISEDQRRGAFIDTVRQDPGGSGDWKQQTEAKERQGVQVAGPGGGHGAYFKDGGRVPFFYGGLAGIL